MATTDHIKAHDGLIQNDLQSGFEESGSVNSDERLLVRAINKDHWYSNAW